MTAAVASLQQTFPGVGVTRQPASAGTGSVWRITVPEKYDVGHEAHFAQVTNNYLAYLKQGKLPAWEVPNMLTKYATVMRAYTMSR